MATLLSIPTSVTILAPGSSVLSTVVAAMAPGSWAQFSAENQNAVLGVGSNNGSVLPYCNAMPWNSVDRCIEIVAGDHLFSGGQRYARYVEATNSFVYINQPGGAFVGGHGYDHLEVNPYTGDLYVLNKGVNGTAPLRVQRKLLAGSTWAPVAALSVPQTIIFGSCWWSGKFTGGSGLGAQGGFAVFTLGGSGGMSTDGRISIYDPVSNSWPFNATSMSPNYGAGTYNQLMAYSAVKNVAVHGGGNVAPKKLWRLNSGGTVTPMPDAPGDTQIGIHRGVLIEDPVSGNFLLLSKGYLYELNPDGAGTWRQQTGSRVPPSGVGIPAESGPNKLVIGVPLPDHGVVAFIRQTNSASSAFYLYKHA